jgi:hypothetical protein
MYQKQEYNKLRSQNKANGIEMRVRNTQARDNGRGHNAKWAKKETIFHHPLVKHAIWDCGGKNGIVQHYREGDNGHCWPITVSNDDCSNPTVSVGKVCLQRH